MSVIEEFWTHIALRLSKELPEEKAPALWSKSDTNLFSIKMHDKIEKTISHATIRRVFKDGHSGSDETRNMFAQYYDYPTYGHYIDANIKTKPKNHTVLLLSLGSLFLLGSYLLYTTFIPTTPLPSKTTQHFDTKEDSLAIKSTVNQSIQYQFASFKAIPNYEPYLDTLKGYYQVGSPAYLEIIDILKGRTGHCWIINNNPNSSKAFLIGDIQIDSIRTNQAFVSTKEYWKLDWFGCHSQECEYIYEAKNDQQYILTKEASSKKWKVLSNTFTGDKFRATPRYIHCDSISDKSSNLLIAKESSKKAIEHGGLDLALKIMECYYRKETTPEFPNKLRLLIAEKNDLLRAVNTDNIDQERFENQKKLLFEKVLVFLDEI